MRGVPLFGLGTTQFFSHELLMIHISNYLSRPILRLLKRLFDLFGASVLLIVLSPLFLLLGYKVSRDGGSVFLVMNVLDNQVSHSSAINSVQWW